MQMKNKLKAYVERFNCSDEEYYAQSIDNAHAYNWLCENIPLFECPDKTLEEIYYFRWWTFRKHIKSTTEGYVITEFLPPVYWSGKYNTIICAAHHHIAEARWLKCGEKIIEDYVLFWLKETGNTYQYSSSFLYSIYEYCQLKNDYSFGVENLDLMIRYYEKMAKMRQCYGGLFCWTGEHDGGEFSISGRPAAESDEQDGIRPTLNSYMAANAYAIYEFARRCKRIDIAEKYKEEYERIRDLILELLWDGEFFKAVHGDDISCLPNVKELPENQDVKEILGYIPWSFDLVPDGQNYEKAFTELKDEKGFKSKYGLTTAEQRHPRFLYKVDFHECLWNGYIWPFAVSQTLNAVINVLDHYHQDIIKDQDFYEMLLTYAKMHYLKNEDGTKTCWIDEVIHPLTGEWSSRNVLKKWGWREDKGGYERGKDYNHSTFCDLIIRGLLGIKTENGILKIHPRIPDDWKYFKLDNLWIGKKCYEITYDKYGTYYNHGVGLKVIEK